MLSSDVECYGKQTRARLALAPNQLPYDFQTRDGQWVHRPAAWAYPQMRASVSLQHLRTLRVAFTSGRSCPEPGFGVSTCNHKEQQHEP